MINLLPFDTKKQIRAARLNVILFRYIIILGFSAVFLFLACTTTYLFINSNNKNNETMNKTSSYSSLQRQVNLVRNDLEISRQIFDRQLSYSDVITKIASNLPTGTTLKSLALTDDSFGAKTNLQIYALSADLETNISENFQKSTNMFSNYEYQSTTPTLDSSSDYNFIINISVIINKAAF